MTYRVLIQDNATGERVWVSQSHEWDDTSLFWWTDGNMGCDCNRALEFESAKGRDRKDVDIDCGKTAFTAICAEMPDGSCILLDAHQ